MLWMGIGLAILIIAGWIIYSRQRGTVTLTKDQAEMVLGVVRKERTEIEKKKQTIIDECEPACNNDPPLRRIGFQN